MTEKGLYPRLPPSPKRNHLDPPLVRGDPPLRFLPRRVGGEAGKAQAERFLQGRALLIAEAGPQEGGGAMLVARPDTGLRPAAVRQGAEIAPAFQLRRHAAQQDRPLALEALEFLLGRAAVVGIAGHGVSSD